MTAFIFSVYFVLLDSSHTHIGSAQSYLLLSFSESFLSAGALIAHLWNHVHTVFSFFGWYDQLHAIHINTFCLFCLPFSVPVLPWCYQFLSFLAMLSLHSFVVAAIYIVDAAIFFYTRMVWCDSAGQITFQLPLATASATNVFIRITVTLTAALKTIAIGAGTAATTIHTATAIALEHAGITTHQPWLTLLSSLPPRRHRRRRGPNRVEGGKSGVAERDVHQASLARDARVWMPACVLMIVTVSTYPGVPEARHGTVGSNIVRVVVIMPGRKTCNCVKGHHGKA